MNLRLPCLAALLMLSACVGPAPTPCTQCDGICVDVQNDARHCGACGTACAAGSICRAGACTVSCQAGQTSCGSTCTDTRVDTANCGACGMRCGVGQSCVAGACTTQCPSNQNLCGQVCASLMTDPANCGTCGRACPTGAVCRAGQCAVQCQPGQLSCDGGACINGQTENQNCGACGVTCGSGEVCSNGTCGTSCANNLTTCGGDGGVRTCADVQTDNTNCGACGVTCGAGEVCFGGMCRPTCGVGQSLCSQNPNLPYCATLTSDNANCGACGVSCAAGESCQSGSCRPTCATGTTSCGADAGVGGTCVDTRRDSANCGGCGIVCAAGQACTNGTCGASCSSGQTICGADAGMGGFCASLQTDNTNCGACGTTCAQGQACQASQCVGTCSPSTTLCGADAGMPFCTNTRTDVANCGSCGAPCGLGEACVNGSCQATCATGTTLCAADGGTSCVNLAFDQNNCGLCGQTCTGGCQGGFCGGGFVTVNASLNLSSANLPGRTCAQGGEMVRYPVIGLTATTAVVSTTPTAGCLAAGDEVLLINLQGTATASVNVGNYELRRIVSVSGPTITFQTPKTRFYGDGPTNDMNLGTARTNQRVVLQRVPTFGTLLLGPSAQLTADPWDGASGGVFALRATSRVQLSGTIDMSARGYAGAPRTTTTDSTGRQGEGPAGLGVVDDRPATSAGGGGRGESTGCVATFGSAGAGAGHATWGGKGSTFCGGHGGAPVGSASMTKVFLGAGGAAGGTDTLLTVNPPGGAGGRGGGIVMLLTPALELAGTVDVSGANGEGDPAGTNCAGNTSTTSCWDNSGPGGGGAGGSLFSTATFVTGASFLRALGGRGGDGSATLAGIGGRGSYGRVLPMPVTCADLNAGYGDGEYLFAFGGDPTRAYLAFCTGVGTATPRMYLTLHNRETTQNFARYDASQFTPGPNNVIVTRFTRVRFDPISRRIVPNDFTFSTSTGQGIGGPFGVGNTVTQWPFGWAGDCSGGAPRGAANIDLRGLPFALSPVNFWEAQGAGPSGTTTASLDDQVLAVTGGGFCGDNRPRTFGGEIELVWREPRQNCQAFKTALPAAGDGVYAVSPSPSFPALPVTCDMTYSGGGWVLLANSNGVGAQDRPDGTPVLTTAPSYLPLPVLQALTTQASVLHLRTTGNAAGRSFTTTANSAPIVNLRQGLILNTANYSVSDYSGPVLSFMPNPLDRICGTVAKGWPNIYHACGNGMGLHWLSDVSSWTNAPGGEPLQLYAR